MTWIAVSETTKSNGKQQSITRITRAITTVAVMTSGAAIAAPPVNQLPTNGQIAAGIAAIATNGNAMTVTQSSNRAAINWNSFDIGSAASVNFVQPSSSSVALNRINSANPSQIFGSLSANGQVYLINPSGVYFAPGAQVNVGGIVATTMSMSDADFMAGSTTFNRNGSTGKVINEGTIQTSLNGYIAMLAPEVRNSGLLLAQSGTVALAAGESITLNFGPTSKLDSITVTAANLDALIENRQAIKAPNGLVILSARAATQLAASVINTGSIEAKGMSQQGGRIILEGSTVTNTGSLDVSSDLAQAGTIVINGKAVSISGRVVATSPVQGGTLKVQATQYLSVNNVTIDASSSQRGGQVQLSGGQVAIADSTINADGDRQGGEVQVVATNTQITNPFNNPFNSPTSPLTAALTGLTGISSRSRNGQGGNVTILGDHISLDGNTTIDVSGATGGGNLLVGGDWQGSNGTHQATTVYIGVNATIDASATDNGNGGKVVLWSDVTNANSITQVDGTIRAQGANGAGGQIETSGHYLGVNGSARVEAGAGGQWLLDPLNIIISNGSQTYGTDTYPYNNVNNATLSTSLNSNDVTIQTWGSSHDGIIAGTLSINGDISKTSGGTTSLILKANSSISGAGNIGSTSGLLRVTFNTSADSGTYSGALTDNVTFTKEGAGTTYLTGANTYTGGTGVMGGSLGVSSDSKLGATTGGITLGGGGALFTTTSFTLNSSRSIAISSGQNGGIYTSSGTTLTYGGVISGAGNFLKDGAGTLVLTGASTLTGAANITTSGSILQVGNGGSLDSVSSTNLGSGTTLTFNRSGDFSFGANISGSGTLLKLGDNTATFTGLNTQTGSVNVSAGGVVFTNNAPPTPASGTLDFIGSGNVTIQPSTSFSSALSTSDYTFASTISGLTVGKTGNAGAINVDSNVSNGGSINIYGGNITLSNNLTSAAGNISLTVLSGKQLITGSAVPILTADNITVNTDYFNWVSGKQPSFNTTGAVIIQPTGASFTNVQNYVNTSWFSLGSGVSNFTLGKSGNALNISVNALLNVSGSINLYSGNITLSQNITTANAAAGAGDIYIEGNLVGATSTNNITLSSSSSLTVNQSGSTSFAGAINGAGTRLIKSGSGTLTLTSTSASAANQNISSTNITAGTLSASYLGALTAVNVSNGATFNVTATQTVGSIEGAGNVNIGTASYVLSAGGNNNSTTLSGNITGSGGFTKQGTGTLTLSGTNTYANTTTVSAGTLEINGSLSDSTSVNVSSGAIYNVSSSDTIGSFSGAGRINLGNGYTLTAFGDDSSKTFSGVMAGSGEFNKTGNGTLTLTGANTYTGNTTIGVGTLQIGDGTANGSIAGTSEIVAYGNLTFNRTGSTTLSANLSGNGVLTVNGGGTLTFLGMSNLNGNVDILNGTFQLGDGGTAGSLYISPVRIATNGLFVVNHSDDVRLDIPVQNYTVSSQGRFASIGLGTTTLTGSATFTGNTTVNNGSVIFAYSVAPKTSGFAGNGTVTIDPNGSAFSSAFYTGNYTFANTLTGLTIGNATSAANANLTVNGTAISIAGTTNLYGGNIALNTSLTTTSGFIRLGANTNITQNASGILTSAGLALMGGNVSLTSVANNITTLAAQNISGLAFKNAGNLTIGTVNPTGIAAIGLVNITVDSGNISLTEAITTTDTSSSAVELNAGAGATAGTATGGNILVSGNAALPGSISVGAGGRATLYTGSVAGSTGLTALLGSGSGRFRYNSDESATNYNTTAAPLNTGVYAIYREQPTLTISTVNASVVYGTSTNNTLSSSAVNGDTMTQIFGAANVPVVAINGTTSTAGFYTVGNHTANITPATVANYLGYATPTYSNGTVTITRANLTVSGTQVANTTYNNNTVASFSSNGTLVGVLSNSTSSVSDVVNLSASGNFSSKNVGTNISVAMSDTISGTDADNYNITQPTSVTGNITPRTVSLSANQAYSGSVTLTNVTITTGVAGETLTYSAATANSSGVADNGANYITAITLANQSGATLTAGGLATNYQLPSILNVSSAPVTITTAPLTITANNTSTQYGLGTTLGTTAFSSSGLQNSETIGSVVLASIGTANTTNVGSYNITATGASGGNFTASNYNISYANGTLNITAAPITLTATNLTRAYGSSNPTTDTVVVTSGSLYNGNTLGNATVTSLATSTTNAGQTVNLTPSSAIFTSGSAGNYNITYANGSLSITQANLTITANNTSTQYGLGTTLGTTAFSSSGLQNSETIGSVVLASSGTANTTNVGSYEITPASASGGNFTASNYNISYVNGTLSITAAPLGISANGTYSGSTVVIPSAFSLTGLMNGETITSISSLSVNNANVSSNGANYVTAIGLTNGTANLANYQLTQAYNAVANTSTTNVFTMAKANLTVTADNSAIFATQTIPSVYNVSYTGFVGGQNANTSGIVIGTVTNSATSSVAGNYTLSPTGFSSANYNITNVNGSFDILAANKLLIQVTSTNTSYGAAINYADPTVQYMNGNMTIANLTLASHSGNTFTYADGSSGTVTFTLGVANATYSASNNLNVGGYQITGSNFSQTSPNFNGTAIYTGSSAVNAVSLTASTSNVSKVYDGTTSMVGLNIGLSPIVPGDIVSASGAGAFGQANVGSNISYNISGLTLNGASAGNYYLSGGTSFSGTNGVITAAPLTITANNTSTQYGLGTTLGTTAFSSSGLVNGETLTGVILSSTGSAATANAGSYNISGSSAIGANGFVASNYNISYANGTLTVTPANITVALGNLSRSYGAANPTSDAVTLTAGTLYNGDTLGNATVSSTATSTTAAGQSSNITGSSQNFTSGLAANYNVSYTNGTLSVTPAPLGISAVGVENGAVTIVPTSYTLTGLQNGETLSVSSLNVASASPISNNYITSLNGVSGSASISNYQLNSVYNGILGTNLTNIFTFSSTPQPTPTPTPSTGIWTFQQIMVQGGTAAFIPLPKNQVAYSDGTHRATSFGGEVLLLSDNVLEDQNDSQNTSNTNVVLTNRYFGDAPQITLLPEKIGGKLVKQGNYIFVVNTDRNLNDLQKSRD